MRGLIGQILYAWVGQIEPIGDLPIGDDVDVPHPWCMNLNGPQGIPQFLHIAIDTPSAVKALSEKKLLAQLMLG